MDEKQFSQLIKGLKNIEDKLTILVNVQKASVKQPELTNEEKIILKMCNGKNTVPDMVKSTNKTRNSIDITLSRLRKKGIIKSTSINKKTVYVRL